MGLRWFYPPAFLSRFFDPKSARSSPIQSLTFPILFYYLDGLTKGCPASSPIQLVDPTHLHLRAFISTQSLQVGFILDQSSWYDNLKRGRPWLHLSRSSSFTIHLGVPCLIHIIPYHLHQLLTLFQLLGYMHLVHSHIFITLHYLDHWFFPNDLTLSYHKCYRTLPTP